MGKRMLSATQSSHKREAVQSTKMFIVFDALVKAKLPGLSLNNCLETGSLLGTISNQLPCLETLLSTPSSSCGLEKKIVTFRFHCIRDIDSSPVETEVHTGFIWTCAVTVSSSRDLETTFRSFKN